MFHYSQNLVDVQMKVEKLDVALLEQLVEQELMVVKGGSTFTWLSFHTDTFQHD